MRPAVRRAVTAALLIAWLQRPGAADPITPETHHDPAAAPTASPTPWIDQGTSPVTDVPEPTAPADHRLASALTLGGLYAGFATGTYFAWYREHKPLDQFRSAATAGSACGPTAGADKLGTRGRR
jgi:hypothetical protein